MEQVKLYIYYSFIFYIKKMQRVALINWENINQDYDLSKILESLATPWVVKGLEVQSWKVTKWYSFVEITRNSTKFLVLFENTEELNINTSGTKKIFIEINQNNIDDGSFNESNWEWIWVIKIASNYPTKNFLKLASIDNWIITDEREFLDIRSNFNVTQQGNTFNLANRLLKLNWSWKVPINNLPILESLNLKEVVFTTTSNWVKTIHHNLWKKPKYIQVFANMGSSNNYQSMSQWFYNTSTNSNKCIFAKWNSPYNWVNNSKCLDVAEYTSRYYQGYIQNVTNNSFTLNLTWWTSWDVRCLFILYY